MNENTIKNRPQRSSPAQSPRKAKKITSEYLHNSGLYYLQRFASSKGNFIRVMDRKIRRSCKDHPDQDYAACRELLEKLADRFEQSGLLNDDVYINAMIESLRRRGFSRNGLLNKLAQKGITRDVALLSLQQKEDTPETEIASAFTFAKKKRIGPFARTQDEKTMNRFLSSMARAGYSYEMAQKVLKDPYTF